MRILVLSDTHIPSAAKVLPEIIAKEAKASDCCIHAGDFTNMETLTALRGWTKVYAVCGNMDCKEIKETLPLKQVLPFEGFTFALTHGRGAPTIVTEYVKNEFAAVDAQIDLFIHGHSHIPTDINIEGKAFFNPGSPTDSTFTPYRSYGIIEINNGQMQKRIVKIG
jgi:hypothetical protein